METIININDAIYAFAWGPVMLVLLLGTGIFLTIRTHWIQIGKFGFIMRNTLGSLFKKRGKGSDKNLSPFQAVSTALAGTVGTGNIAGVTGAIFAGGPGAVFWMWVSAFFGMCTKYSEIVLSMKYRETDQNGAYRGGPMYYIKNGLGKNWKWLAVVFSLLGGLACFGIGNLSQASEIAGAVVTLTGAGADAAGTVRLVTGIVLAVVVAVVIVGGVKRIGQVTSYLVPVMSILYIAAGILVLVLKITSLPATLWLIVKSAFSFEAVGGGLFGIAIMNAMKNGFSRGVFSNEAGLGSAAMAHAASSTEEPCEQAIWGVFEVFIDTIIICTITAFAVLMSGVLDVPGGLDAFAAQGAAAVTAFNMIIPGTLTGAIIQISLLFFALSTIIGWAYYGENCWGYISGGNKVVLYVYKALFVVMCVVGSTGSGKLMWDIAATLNGLMAIPNLIALLPLSGVVVQLTREYFEKADPGKKLRKSH